MAVSMMGGLMMLFSKPKITPIQKASLLLASHTSLHVPVLDINCS